MHFDRKYLCLILLSFLLLYWRSFLRSLRTSAVHAHWSFSLFAVTSSIDYDPSHLYHTLVDLGIEIPTKGGCVWDVGAHNGVLSSNSLYLIRAKNFQAYLFEPASEQFARLVRLHHDQHARRVEIFNVALGGIVSGITREGEVSSSVPPLVRLRSFPTGTESTTNSQQVGQFDSAPEFTSWVGQIDARIVCEQLRVARNAGKCGNMTVLSVDTEGSDQSILLRILRGGGGGGGGGGGSGGGGEKKKEECAFDVVIAEKMSRTKMERELGYRRMIVEGYNTVYVGGELAKQLVEKGVLKVFEKRTGS